MPVTITRPLATARSARPPRRTAAPSPSWIAAISAAMPPASVSSVRSAEAISGRARGARCSGFAFGHSLTSRVRPDQLARKRAQGERPAVNATLTILVLHPLTISRASRGREDVLRAACRFKVFLRRPASARSWPCSRPRMRSHSRRRARAAACARPSRTRGRTVAGAPQRARARARTGRVGALPNFDNPDRPSRRSFGNPPASARAEPALSRPMPKRRPRPRATAPRPQCQRRRAPRTGAALADSRRARAPTAPACRPRPDTSVRLPDDRRPQPRAEARRRAAPAAGAAAQSAGAHSRRHADRRHRRHRQHHAADDAPPRRCCAGAPRRGGCVRAARPARRRVPGLPAVEVTGGYDTNPARTPGGRASSFVTVSPELLAQFRLAAPRGDRDACAAATRPTARRPSSTGRAFDGKVTGRLDVTRNTALIGEGTLVVGTDNPGSPNVQAGLSRFPIFTTLGGTPRPHAALQSRRSHREGHGGAHRVSGLGVHRRHHARATTTATSTATPALMRTSYDLMPGLKPFVEVGATTRASTTSQFDRFGAAARLDRLDREGRLDLRVLAQAHRRDRARLDRAQLQGSEPAAAAAASCSTPR